jgi:hypothetical protein
MAACKDAAISGIPEPVPQTAGDDLANPFVIPILPYEDAGNTCGFIDDYDEECPYGGSTSPDVVYRWTAWPSDQLLDISLCTSSYDTKVFVYENGPSELVACNDDACGFDGFRSELLVVPLSAGNDYYIVVDGYGGACGDYELAIHEIIGEHVECPPGGYLEGEPPCADDYVDEFNGGCNSIPPVFSSLPCAADPGQTVYVCGEAGGFDFGGLDSRDTDWSVVEPALNEDGFTCCGDTEIELVLGYLPAVPCDEVTGLTEHIVLQPFAPDCLDIPPGAQYLFLASSDYGPMVGCGDYVLSLTGYDCGAVAVEAASWGRIKSRYREHPPRTVP